jgi:ADP-ribose pyrophosphatase
MQTWQKLEEKHVYKGYRHILRKTFRLPNQQISDYDIVDAPSYVAIGAITKNQEIILVEQFRPAPEQMIISVPEGQIDKNENPFDTVKRELLEETGYTCEEVVFLKDIPESYAHTRKKIYLAIGCTYQQAQDLDETEFIRVFTVSLDEFKTLMKNPLENNFTSVDVGFLMLNYLNLL